MMMVMVMVSLASSLHGRRNQANHNIFNDNADATCHPNAVLATAQQQHRRHHREPAEPAEPAELAWSVDPPFTSDLSAYLPFGR